MSLANPKSPTLTVHFSSSLHEPTGTIIYNLMQNLMVKTHMQFRAAKSLWTNLLLAK